MKSKMRNDAPSITTAIAAPTTWQTTKAGTDDGLMPANVFVNADPDGLGTRPADRQGANGLAAGAHGSPWQREASLP